MYSVNYVIRLRGWIIMYDGQPWAFAAHTVFASEWEAIDTLKEVNAVAGREVYEIHQSV